MIPLLSDVLVRKFLKKLCQDSAPEEVFQTYNNLRATKGEISEAEVKLFQYLYSNIDKPLNQKRYDMLMTKGIFKPEKLSTTSGAAMQHALRAYFQYRDWLLLESLTAKHWTRENLVGFITGHLNQSVRMTQ